MPLHTESWGMSVLVPFGLTFGQEGIESVFRGLFEDETVWKFWRVVKEK